MGGILAIGWFDASEVDYLHPTHYSVVYRIQYIQYTVYSIHVYIYIHIYIYIRVCDPVRSG